MAEITVATTIAAAPQEVWADIAHIDRHVEWMADARSVAFLGDQREGVGTRIEVETRVGPLRTTDIMEFTVWDPPHRMGVRHDGLISGTGYFELLPIDGATRFTWHEELTFPWWLGGRLGAWLARPVLSWVWRRNLDRLRRRFG